jgi:HlyD family secretion protein
MTGKRRWRWLWLLAVVGGLVLLWQWPRAVEVELANIERGLLRVTIDVEARTRVRDRWTVAAPVPGLLLRLPWRAGDEVRADEVVAHLQPLAPTMLDLRTTGELRAQLETVSALAREAEAAVDSARTVEQHARREWLRQVRLLAAGASAEIARDAAATEMALRRSARVAAEARHRSLTHEHRRIAAQLQPPPDAAPSVREVRAPATGQVLRVWQQGPGPVAAGTPLLELGDPRALEVVADVLTPDAVLLPDATSATFSQWGGEGPLHARLRRVEPGGFTKVSALGVEEQRVWTVLDPVGNPQLWSRLGDGYRLDAQIVVWQGEVVRAPTAALLRQAGRWYVFVANGGRARLREVRLGHRGAQQVEVLAGLKPGERVVVFPGAELRNGVRVRAAATARTPRPEGVEDAAAGNGGE